MKYSDVPYEIIALSKTAEGKASRINTLVGLVLLLVVLSVVPPACNNVQAIWINIILLSCRASFTGSLSELEKHIEPIVVNDGFSEYDFQIVDLKNDTIYGKGHNYKIDNPFKRLHAIIRYKEGYIIAEVSTYPDDPSLVTKYHSIFAEHMTSKFRARLQDIIRHRAAHKELVAPDIGILRFNISQDMFPISALFFAFILSLLHRSFLTVVKSLACEINLYWTQQNAQEVQHLSETISPSIFITQHRGKWWYPFSRIPFYVLLLLCVVMTFGKVPQVSFWYHSDPPVVLDGSFNKPLLTSLILIASYRWTKRIIERDANTL